eukprot:COSAG04_NODE_2377_length_4238_cov_4.969105_2_plen_72_part_00
MRSGGGSGGGNGRYDGAPRLQRRFEGREELYGAWPNLEKYEKQKIIFEELQRRFEERSSELYGYEAPVRAC